jgi:hypothetical protein
MITDITGKYVTKELERTSLSDYWGQYFSYEKDVELCGLTENEFQNVIKYELTKDKPYIDSQIAINAILGKLSKKHNFHRQFNGRHPDLVKEAVLGMQLYKILVEDKNVTWTYYEKHNEGHVFPHSTYFKKLI